VAVYTIKESFNGLNGSAKLGQNARVTKEEPKRRALTALLSTSFEWFEKPLFIPILYRIKIRALIQLRTRALILFKK
jgi:hypothetical protein